MMFSFGVSQDVELEIIRLLRDRVGDVWEVTGGTPVFESVNTVTSGARGLLVVREVSRERVSRVTELVTVGFNAFTSKEWSRQDARGYLFDVAGLIASPFFETSNSATFQLEQDSVSGFIQVPNADIRGEQYYMQGTWVSPLAVREDEC